MDVDQLPEVTPIDPTGEPEVKDAPGVDPWPEHFNTALAPFFSEDALAALKQMWLEGAEPPRISDNGWGERTSKPQVEGDVHENSSPAQHEKREESSKNPRGGRGGRGNRGGRAGGKRGRAEDNRKVLSEVNRPKSIAFGLLNKFVCSLLIPKRREQHSTKLSVNCSRVVSTLKRMYPMFLPRMVLVSLSVGEIAAVAVGPLGGLQNVHLEGHTHHTFTSLYKKRIGILRMHLDICLACYT